MTLSRFFLVCSVAVCFSGFAAEPRLGPERAITALNIASSAGPKFAMATATDGKDFFVVWSDRRSGGQLIGGQQIMGARVSASGEILDPLGILIAETADPFSVDVSWRDDSYAVDYEYRPGTAPTEYRTVSVDRDGRVGDYTVRGSRSQIWPRNGNGDTIVTRYERGIFMLWFEGADGRWRAPVDVSGWGYLFDIFPIGNDDWIGVFQNATGGHWVHLQKGVGVVRSLSMTPGGVVYGYARATDETNVGVVWRTPDGRAAWTVVTVEGQLSSGRLEPADGVDFTYYPYSTEAISDGEAFHFATEWRDPHGHIHLKVFRVSNGMTSESRDVMPGDYSMPQLEAGDRNLLTWRRSNATGTVEVVIQLFDKGGSADDGELMVLSRAGAFQDAARAAAGMGGALATWREIDGELLSIRARLLPDSGTSPPPFTVATGIDVRSARVAECNGTYAIIWIDTEVEFKKTGGWQREEERLMLRRYDAQGTPLDSSPIVLISHGFLTIEIARRANGYQVVWKDRNHSIWSLFVTVDGTVTPSSRPMLVAHNADVGGTPVISAGDSALILWSEIDVPEEDLRFKNRTLRVSRVSPGGVIGISVALQSVGIERPDPFAAASDGTRLMFLWPAERKGLPCIASRLFSLDGLPLSLTETIACGAFSATPAVEAGWDGERWWVITSGRDRMFAHTISADGNPLTTFEVARASSIAPDSELVHTATGTTVFYARPDETAGHSQRGFLRSLTATPRIRSVRH